ncbi:MBL fold metallo-hydrolase [Nocardia sp. ET3-3]|uniref:Linear primary-alkylsulfatase n=1 Tax=Nocardia terrae TaxID=2675851 RepID=A0A7K1VB57_9NOCA|nr:alkyl sulfatase dimerization domain-containing protein [Nocardia terrae]MVU83880.1 MBL fold metallo-hydrolase [Nocardia terrae]
MATEPTAHIVAAHQRVLATLPFADTTDFDDATRGLIARPDSGAITDDQGNVVWDGDSYGFLGGDCPYSVNPSLWRQSELASQQGLFEVAPGIYQVRGFDISNMTLIEGETGVVVIDPLTTRETAAAALRLYRDHRAHRPVTGLIYTHSHIDHFGGAEGVLAPEDAASGRCPVIAPEGFLEHAVAENIFAGTAMARRAGYMFGTALPRGERGTVGTALGQTIPVGSAGIIAPTVDIVDSGQELTVDGVRLVFQLTPDTEAPAEMNVYLPGHRALCMAENAIHTMHNLLTLRGALVRDAHNWAKYLTEAVNRYARNCDVVFSSHLWPTWGTERVVKFMSLQRDMYGYLHDQTLRKLNQGLVGTEIAEDFPLPPALENTWHTRGYYGTVSHNVKAVYQRYMGWYDGNPAHLWQHPPVESATRHVEFMGGADEVLRKARAAYEAGDFRWVAQVVDYVIFADPANAEAKALQADTFEQLGYGAESATWRNVYLSGAYELRHGSFGTPTKADAASSMLYGLTVEQIFDAMALRVDGPKAWHLKSVVDWKITDQDRVHRIEMSNGLLVHYDRFDGDGLPDADATFELAHPTLVRILLMEQDFPGAVARGELAVHGDVTTLGGLVAALDEPDPDFAMVTP